MQTLIKLNIEKYEEEGQEYFVATSDDLQGLVAEGQTLEEVIEIAEDVARILLEMEQKDSKKLTLFKVPNQFEYPLILEI
ncbi:type II toxin-antitoxin system HicB family antitoxin [Limnofasciculus baicalensis]|uniref:DUF1902 domain-containing protein n=1 Tax=Limnofasciculus baicalensis BBK-W-15 TaxID=2699891 RepID=A0AAE3GWC9_9CYAN|nr:DUF1902 domain-containing protein [Limnofasciculus baicalensis]MCP2731845.1 DUF1902 domain-containing protein [Limnofasciculus baicalensis BBK-W-15]